MITNTDAVLWYNVEKFGEAGYAVPNFSDDPGTLNPNIASLVSLVGQNLFAVMHHEDADLTIPPSVNTCIRVHRLYLRLLNVLASRAIPPGQPNMETEHVRPAGSIFLVYPVPFFNVRNPYMFSWCNWIMMMLSEMMQHTENRKEIEISTTFSADIGQYMKRVYTNMAVELFGKTAAEVLVPGFALQDADFTAYNPSKFFTSIEMVDTVPRLDRVFTEDQLAILRQGIYVTDLPDTVKPYPRNLTNLYAAFRRDATSGPDGKANQPAAGSGSGGSGTTVAPTLPNPSLP